MRHSIELIIPGLAHLSIAPKDEQRLQNLAPSLHRLIRYAEPIEAPISDFDELLIRRLRLQQSALPYAQACQPDAGNNSLLLTPVHLKMDMNNAVVLPVMYQQNEISHIINDLNDYFKNDFNIRLLAGSTWLLQLTDCQPLTGVPHYLVAAGKKVTHYMEQAETNLQWTRLFNEVQMYLHQHPVNQQKLLAGEATFNSLWCWGADRWQGERQQLQWFSDEAELLALGQLLCDQAAPLADVSQTNLKDGLVIDVSILKALKGGVELAVESLVERLEQQLFEPLLNHYRGTVILRMGSQNDYVYHSRQRLKFWMRRRGLSQLV